MESIEETEHVEVKKGRGKTKEKKEKPEKPVKEKKEKPVKEKKEKPVKVKPEKVQLMMSVRTEDAIVCLED